MKTLGIPRIFLMPEHLKKYFLHDIIMVVMVLLSSEGFYGIFFKEN